MTPSHYIFDDKVRIYRRENSKLWQVQARFNGQKWRVSTKTDNLEEAKAFAEEWYIDLRSMDRVGLLKREKTFHDAAKKFLAEYDVVTGGTRNQQYIAGNERRLRLYLLPFFGRLGLSEVTSGKVQEYRVMRHTPGPDGKRPARNTLHQEMVVLRQVLKTALRAEWLTHLPDLSEPYQSSRKISHRAWFSPEEYKKLYTATRNRVQRHKGKRFQRHAEQLHDYVLFMANTGLRPDEANRLQYRDVEIVEDADTGETILLITVRGKRGVGFCKSTANAVYPFRRLVERNSPQPVDLMFPDNHTIMFNTILAEEGLKFDREGNRRTAYSLRHTYICLRLMGGADIYQIAKNCRTSVEMIEKHYATHISTSINAAAVNVKRKTNAKLQEFYAPES